MGIIRRFMDRVIDLYVDDLNREAPKPTYSDGNFLTGGGIPRQRRRLRRRRSR